MEQLTMSNYTLGTAAIPPAIVGATLNANTNTNTNTNTSASSDCVIETVPNSGAQSRGILNG
jgi:hypothetical protein